MASPDILQLQAKKDVDGLIAALRYPDPGVRKGAAAALHVLGVWQAVPALQAALAVENDWQVHAAFTAALQYLDRDIHVERMIKEKDVRGLTKMLYSNKHEDILTACKALGEIGDKRASETLVMVFRNPLLPNNLRLAAAESLLKMDAAPAVVTLLGALRRDNWQIRRNAAAVLGQLQATWAVEPLVAALNDENQAVRRTAVAALRRMGTSEAMRALTDFEESQGKAITQEVPRPDTSQLRNPIKQTGALKSPKTEPLPEFAAKPQTGALKGPQTEPLPDLASEQIMSGLVPPKMPTGTLPDPSKPKPSKPETTPLPPLQATAEPKPATGTLSPKVQTQRLQTGMLPIVLDQTDATKPKATGVLPKTQTGTQPNTPAASDSGKPAAETAPAKSTSEEQTAWPAGADSAKPATGALPPKPTTGALPAAPDLTKSTTESPSVAGTGNLKSVLQKLRDTQQMKKADPPASLPETKADEPPASSQDNSM